MSALKIKENEFEPLVLHSDKTVLVDFWATWCGPCQELLPVMDEFAEKHPEYVIAKINIDDAGDLIKKFHIVSVPTLIAFRDGKEIKRASGVLSETEILDLLKG